MRKVTTRYVLTINPYQIVRENWVVGKILSLVLSLCFFFKKKSTNSVGTPEKRQILLGHDKSFGRERNLVG